MIHALTSLLLASTLAGQDAQTYTLAVKEDAAIARVTELRTTHEFLLSDMNRQMGENEPIIFDAAGTVSTEHYARWRDDFSPTGPLGVPSLRRQFQRLDMTGRGTLTMPGMPTKPAQIVFGSDFQGRTLVFTWSPEEQQYGHCYDYYDGPEEPLRKVRFEADCRSALPTKPVAIGERWLLNAEQTRDLLTSGGDLSMTPTAVTTLARSIKLGLGSSLPEVLDGDVFGQCEVVLRSVESVDVEGEMREVATLGLENLSIQTLADRTDGYEELMSDEEKREPAAVDGVVIDTRLNGSGELRWDVAGGHLISLQVGGDEVSDLRIAKLFGDEPRIVTVSENARYKGIWKVSMTTSKPAE